MDFEDFHRFNARAAEADVMFFYQGDFNGAVISAAAHSLGERLAAQNAAASVRRRLFSTFIEMAQNVLHYGVATPAAHGGTAPGTRGAIGVGRGADGRYWIQCTSFVDTARVGRLSSKLDAVRTMSLDEVKRTYKARLHEADAPGTDDESRGAGLGLLTIARDATELDYRFTPVPSATLPTVAFHVRAVI